MSNKSTVVLLIILILFAAAIIYFAYFISSSNNEAAKPIYPGIVGGIEKTVKKVPSPNTENTEFGNKIKISKDGRLMLEKDYSVKDREGKTYQVIQESKIVRIYDKNGNLAYKIDTEYHPTDIAVADDGFFYISQEESKGGNTYFYIEKYSPKAEKMSDLNTYLEEENIGSVPVIDIDGNGNVLIVVGKSDGIVEVLKFDSTMKNWEKVYRGKVGRE